MMTKPRHLSLATLVLLTLFFSTLTASARADDEGRRISVSGEAERRVAPDMATLQMRVEIDGVEAATARAEADAITGRALEVIDAAGVDAADRDSSGLTVTPQYRWNKNTQQQELTGYRVSRSIRVRLLDLSQLGELLTELSEAGVNRIDVPRLGLQDEEAIYQEVLAEAARNARERASAVALTLGEELGPVLQVSTQPLSVPRPVMMERAMMASDSAAPSPAESYQSGHINYRVQLSATFSLR